MPKRTCTADGCDRSTIAKGLCPAHYQRLKRLGSTNLPPKRICSAAGCDKKHHARGYCEMHLKRIQVHGSTDAVPRTRKPCTFSGCGRPSVSSGLCDGHTQQAKRGVPLTRLRAVWRSTTRDELGRKRCRGCETWKDEGDFYPVPRQSDGLASRCKRCDRDARLRRQYNITADQYDDLLATQGGVCAICGGLPKDGPSLHIDHDHKCCETYRKSCGRCIRGLLCEDCNRVLGMFDDDPERFEAAMAYLKDGGVRRG